jgi:hypothetical protein
LSTPETTINGSSYNVIDLLKCSLEIEGERAKRSPPLQPSMPKGKAKPQQKAQ